MRKSRLWLLMVGLPGLLTYATLAIAQWRGGLALSEFKRLQEAYPPDSLHPITPAVAAKKMGVLLEASRVTPADPEPVYQAALLNLVLAEEHSLAPKGPPGDPGSGPDRPLVHWLQEGLRSVRRAIRLNPGVADYHFVAALLLQNLSGSLDAGPDAADSETAVAALLEISDRLDPYKASLQYRIGSFQMGLGNRAGARRAFSTVLKQDPDMAKQVFSVLWSFSSSPDELRDFVAHEPRICVLLGEFLRDQGFRDDAQAEYDEAAALGGSDYQVVSGLIRSYFRERTYEKVLELVERLEKARVFVDPHQRASLRYAAGMVHFIQGDLDAAVSAYETALRFDESRLHIHHALAEAFLKQKEYSKAIARWRFVLGSDAGRRQLGSGIEEAYFGLGQAYEGQGKYAEALAQYLRASEMDPQNGKIAARIAEVSRQL